jgi:hypothetical protein
MPRCPKNCDNGYDYKGLEYCPNGNCGMKLSSGENAAGGESSTNTKNEKQKQKKYSSGAQPFAMLGITTRISWMSRSGYSRKLRSVQIICTLLLYSK